MNDSFLKKKKKTKNKKQTKTKIVLKKYSLVALPDLFVSLIKIIYLEVKMAADIFFCSIWL